MADVGYGQQLTQLKGGSIRPKEMYITEDIYYRRQEGAQIRTSPGNLYDTGSCTGQNPIFSRVVDFNGM